MIFKYPSYGSSSKDEKLYLEIKSGAKGSKIELFWGGFEKIIET